MSVGATKVPCARPRGSARAGCTVRPRARIAAIWRDDAVARLGVDHRADVGGESVGIADRELRHRALQHREDAVGDVLLHAEHAQRRAALAGAVEGRGERRRATTCSGSAEESTIIAFWPPVSAISGTGGHAALEPLRELLLDQPRDLGRAGEQTPRDARIGDQRARRPSRRRPAAAAARRRHAGLVQQRARPAAAISGVCSAGLASTGLPAASAAAIWPVKIASGKFHGLMQTTGPSGAVRARCRSRARACAA